MVKGNGQQIVNHTRKGSDKPMVHPKSFEERNELTPGYRQLKYLDVNTPKKTTFLKQEHFNCNMKHPYYTRTVKVREALKRGFPETKRWVTQGIPETHVPRKNALQPQFKRSTPICEPNDIKPRTLQFPKLPKVPKTIHGTEANVNQRMFKDLFDNPMTARELGQLKHRQLINQSTVVPQLLSDLYGLINHLGHRGENSSTLPGGPPYGLPRSASTGSRGSSVSSYDDSSDDDDDNDDGCESGSKNQTASRTLTQQNPADAKQMTRIKQAVLELNSAAPFVLLPDDERRARLLAIKNEFELDPKQMTRISVRKALKDKLVLMGWVDTGELADDVKPKTSAKKRDKKVKAESPAQKLLGMFKKE